MLLHPGLSSGLSYFFGLFQLDYEEMTGSGRKRKMTLGSNVSHWWLISELVVEWDVAATVVVFFFLIILLFVMTRKYNKG